MLTDDAALDRASALLRAGAGDPSALARIRRALEQGEVISAYERRYVEELASEHLGPRAAARAEAPPDGTVTRARREFEAAKARAAAPPPPPPPRAAPRRRRRLLVLALAVAVPLAAGGALYAAQGGQIGLTQPGWGGGAAPGGLTLSSDAESYGMGDIITVSGTAGEGTVRVVVLSGDTPLTLEDAPVRDGEYATMVIAGGDGWAPGEYGIIASQGDSSERVDVTVG